MFQRVRPGVSPIKWANAISPLPKPSVSSPLQIKAYGSFMLCPCTITLSHASRSHMGPQASLTHSCQLFANLQVTLTFPLLHASGPLHLLSPLLRPLTVHRCLLESDLLGQVFPDHPLENSHSKPSPSQSHFLLCPPEQPSVMLWVLLRYSFLISGM